MAAGLAIALATSGPAAADESALPPLVHDIGIGVFLSGMLAILFARIKVPPIAGYILAGIIAGPHAKGLHGYLVLQIQRFLDPLLDLVLILI